MKLTPMDPRKSSNVCNFTAAGHVVRKLAQGKTD